MEKMFIPAEWYFSLFMNKHKSFGEGKNATTPLMVQELPCSVEVACGGYHTCAITSECLALFMLECGIDCCWSCIEGPQPVQAILGEEVPLKFFIFLKINFYIAQLSTNHKQLQGSYKRASIHKALAVELPGTLNCIFGIVHVAMSST